MKQGFSVKTVSRRPAEASDLRLAGHEVNWAYERHDRPFCETHQRLYLDCLADEIRRLRRLLKRARERRIGR